MRSSLSLVVVGAGGHAKVVLATLLAAGHQVGAILDDDPARWGTSLLGHTVSGPIEASRLRGRKAVLAIGDNVVRHRLAGSLAADWVTVIHPQTIVHPSATLGPGSVVFAGSVIQPDVRVGSHVIVNTAASVDHDCEIGDFAHIGPGCRLAGDVRVGEGALLGIGSCVLPGVVIGGWATVGAGGAVVRDVADRTMVAGVPARAQTP